MPEQQQNLSDARPRYTASTITDPALNRLYAELYDLRRRVACAVGEQRANNAEGQ